MLAQSGRTPCAMPETLEVGPVTVADALRRGFVGWLYSTDETGPVAAVAVENNFVSSSPHASLSDAIARDARMVASLNVPENSGRFLRQLYNGGNGVFRGSEGCTLLLPVTAMVAHPTAAAGATEVVVSGVVAKSAEYLVVQQDVFRRLADRLDGYSAYSISEARSGSILAFYGRDPGRAESLRRMASDPDAAQNMVNLHPQICAALISAFRAACVWHSLFSDGGKQFRDPAARSLALEALGQALLSALDASSSAANTRR